MFQSGIEKAIVCLGKEASGSLGSTEVLNQSLPSPKLQGLRMQLRIAAEGDLRHVRWFVGMYDLRFTAGLGGGGVFGLSHTDTPCLSLLQSTSVDLFALS